MGLTVLFVFQEIGSPFELRKQRLDTERSIQLVRIKQGVETFYRLKKTLPNTLDEIFSLPENSLYSKINDPETNKPYEYTRVDDLTYRICAEFSTDFTSTNTTDSRDTLPQFVPVHSEQRQMLPSHPRGHYCYTIINHPQIYIPNTVGTQQSYITTTNTFADEHVKNVTTDAKNIQNYNFPYSMFNTTDEWGLINFTSEPVHLTVTFKEPVKISSITNRFSVCTSGPCYEWEATGKTSNGNELTVVSKTNETYRADPLYLESKKKSQTSELLTSITFTVKRLYTDQFVHWRKLSFEY